MRVRFRWVPGGSFSGTKSWERGSSEAKTVVVSSLLFADDATIVGRKGELGGGGGSGGSEGGDGEVGGKEQ